MFSPKSKEKCFIQLTGKRRSPAVISNTGNDVDCQVNDVGLQASRRQFIANLPRK